MKNPITLFFLMASLTTFSQSIEKYYVAEKADNTYFIEILKEYDATFNKPDILETVVDNRQFVVVPGFAKKGYRDKYYREVILYGNTKGYVNAEEIEIVGNNFEYSERWKKNIADEPEDYMLEKLIANKPSIKEQLAKKFTHTLRLVKTPKGKYYILIEVKGAVGAFVQAKRSGVSILLPNTLSYGDPFVIFKDYKGLFLDATENPKEYEDYLAKGIMKFSNFVTGGVLDWDILMDYAQKLGIGKTEEFEAGSINLSKYTQKEVYWGSYSDTRYNLGPKAKSIQIFIPVNGSEAKIEQEITPESIIYMAGLTLFPVKDRNYSYRTLVYHNENKDIEEKIETTNTSALDFEAIGIQKKDNFKTGQFKVTRNKYSGETDWNRIVFNEFGSGYRVADWNDLVRFVNNGGDILELFDNLGLTDYGNSISVTRNGKKNFSSNRYFFASRHEHKKPSGYAAHDNINRYLISLGSWYGERKILVIKR